MTEIETLGIIDEIESLVSDQRQVVSYKWLSRNFLISSNAAKKLLEEFVQRHGDALEVVYTVAGWLKRTPATYHARLVPRSKLTEAKQDFDDNCSVHVYSVQACIPKDPVALWNAEFVQAAELFKQLLTADNCLKDNRFSGVSNPTMKFKGVPVSTALPQSKSGDLALSESSAAKHSYSVPQPQQIKVQESSSKAGLQPSKIAPLDNSKNNGAGLHDVESKVASTKGKSSLSANRKKGQNVTSSAGSGGSLANLFDRASTKVKSSNASVEADNVTSNTSVSAEAQICAPEALEGGRSDDDGPDVNFKRGSNGDAKKRRVVLDDSDEEVDFENAVNLGSPDPPCGKSSLDLKQNKITAELDNSNLNFDYQKEEKPKIKEEKASDVEFEQPSKKGSLPLENEMASRTAALERVQDSSLANDKNKMNKVVDVAPALPKRRKVLKSRIDERGREVTEVVWEGEEMPVKKNDDNVSKNIGSHAAKTENRTATNPVDRPAIVKKSPAAGSSVATNLVGKAGNKKGGNVKDPKQGNILSFFKRA
ncbi:hypothetical protein Dimus_012725 [Dionaea muscipula]